MKTLIKNASVVLSEGCQVTDVEITDDRFSFIGRTGADSAADRIIDAQGLYLLAGFIDVHSNGIAGFDFTNGWYQGDRFSSQASDYLRGLEQAAAAYAASGTTRVLLTTLAAPLPKLQQVFQLYSSYRQSAQASFLVRNILAGIYIEGTHINDPGFRGAHNADYFIQPSIELFEQLQSDSQRQIRVVNVAPEWGSPALRLIKHVREQGLIAAAGHTGADGDTYQQALTQGINLAVHLFNGPTAYSFKSFSHGGVLEAVLRAPQLTAELIVDGYHVDPAYVLDAIQRKGEDQIVAVTDSMFAARMNSLQEFTILGVEGQVSENRRYLQVKGRKDTLCGSVLTMDQAFGNLLTWFTHGREGVWYPWHDPMPLPQALVKASKLCSMNPAALLGLAETGVIKTGNLADLLVVDIKESESDFQLQVKNVFVRGNQVA